MINTVLFNHLQNQPEVVAALARYNGQAAIFDQEIPPDTDKKWQGVQFPRIGYAFDMTDDPERHISGVLGMDILCENRKQIPEEIELLLKKYVDGYFFSDGTDTIRANWETSNPFTEPEKKVSGVELAFSLLSFPLQTSQSPDPIALMNQYSKDRYQEAFVIGKDTAANAAWKPTDAKPAIYWRLQDLSSCRYIPDTWSCIWMTATLRLHVFSDTNHVRLSREICADLMTRRRLLFPAGDGQLMIDDVRITPGNDAQRVV